MLLLLPLFNWHHPVIASQTWSTQKGTEGTPINTKKKMP